MPLDEIHLEGVDEPLTVLGVGHLDEKIEELEREQPSRKLRKEHKIWKRNINTLIDAVNRLAGFKRYSLKR